MAPAAARAANARPVVNRNARIAQLINNGMEPDDARNFANQEANAALAPAARAAAAPVAIARAVNNAAPVVAARNALTQAQEAVRLGEQERQRAIEIEKRVKSELRRGQSSPDDSLDILVIPDLENHFPFLRLNRNEQECVPFDAIILHEQIQYVPNDILVQIQRDRAQAVNYNQFFQVTNDFDRNMIIQERIRRVIFERKIQGIRQSPPEVRTEIEKCMIDHHREIEDEYRAQEARTRLARSTYPTLKLTGKECKNCGDEASAIAPNYRLHMHRVQEIDNARIATLETLKTEREALDQPVGNIQGSIDSLQDGITTVENETDYYCASCYIATFRDLILGGPESEGGNVCPCPISSCVYSLTPYQMWRMCSGMTDEQILHSKKSYIDESIIKNPSLRTEDGFQLDLLRNVPNLETIDVHIYNFFDKYDNLPRRIRKLERNQGKAAHLATYEEGTHPWRMAELNYDRETTAQLSQLPQINIENMEGFQELLDAMPSPCQRLQEILAKRRVINLNRESDHILILARNPVLNITSRLVQLQEQVMSKQLLLTGAIDEERARADNNRVEQEFQRQLAAYNTRIGDILSQARARQIAYDISKRRFDDQKAASFSFHLETPPKNWEAFCPYCCKFVGSRKRDGDQVYCKYLYYTTHIGHNHNEDGRHFVRCGRRADSHQDGQDLCTVCNGPTCNHSHATLTNPNGLFDPQEDADLCNDDDNRAPNGHLDRVCISEGGGGIIESVARLLAYRDYAVEMIRQNPQGFSLQFPAMLAKATEYAIRIRGHIKHLYRVQRILEPVDNSEQARILYQRCVTAEDRNVWDNNDILIAALGAVPIVPLRGQLEREHPPPVRQGVNQRGRVQPAQLRQRGNNNNEKVNANTALARQLAAENANVNANAALAARLAANANVNANAALAARLAANANVNANAALAARLAAENANNADALGQAVRGLGGGKHPRKSVTRRRHHTKLRKRFAVSKRKRRVGKN